MIRLLSIIKHPLFILFASMGIFILLISLFFIDTSKPSTIKPKPIPTRITSTPRVSIEGPQAEEPSSEDDPLANEVFPPDDYYGDADPSGLENVQKIEDLPDGTKKYIATSSNPTRPNIVIAKDNRTIYQREIPSSEADIPLQNFIELFGQPDQIINGPDFYGANNTREYIYSQKGIAVVVNTNNDQVIEQHFFKQMTVDEYIKKYSNDKF